MSNSKALSPASPPAFCLRDGLRFVPQSGSREWHCVVESPQNQRFFRLGRREYLIASALQEGCDLNTLVTRLAETNPKLDIDALTIEQTLRWLISTGLAKPVQTSETAQANASAIAPPASGSMIDPFMFRIPILSGRVLESAVKQLGFLCSKISVIISLMIMLAALACFAADPSYFFEMGAKLFVPSATLWWMSAWLLLKAVHEFGHAVVCVSLGGQLRGAGIASFYFAPVPYIDTTDMWRLPDRRARAYCALGGMWLEMLVSAIAILICQSVSSPSIQYFCISIATLGTFTTIAFNANPLVRFDGYYILSDTIDRPNLYTNGQTAWKNLWSGSIGLLPSVISVHGLPLIAYGFACFVNRILMMIGLAWGAWAAYSGLGLGLIAFACYLWFVAPLLRKRKLLQVQAALSGQSANSVASKQSPWKQWSIGLCGVSLAVCLAYVIPSPLQPVSPGFVSYGEPNIVRAQSDGIVVEVYQSNDSRVEKGVPIVRLENLSLTLECDKLRGSLTVAQERCLVLRAQAKMPELQAEQARVEAMQKQLQQIEEQLAQLIVVAPQSGRLIARTLHNTIGQLIKAGQPLAVLVQDQAIEVHCSIFQNDVEAYRQQLGHSAEVYLSNSKKLRGTVTDVRPRGSDTLENPALAARYGGPISVHMTSKTNENESSLITETPRFEARLSIEGDAANSLTPGQLCRVGLVERQMSIAGILARWKNAFIEWVKPDQAKS